MKIVIITDTHAGVRNDNKSLRTKQQLFYDQLFFPYIQENGIRVLFHLGDVFDRRKFVNYDTLNWWNRTFIRRLNELNLESHVIVGNHDCYYKTTNSVNSLTDVYPDTEKFNVYWDKPADLQFGSSLITLVPWLAPDNQEVSLKHIRETNSNVLMGHFEINGFTMHKGHVCEEGLDSELFSKFHSVYSGHFHTRSSARNITYLGAPYEMTWNDHGESRGFHVFDTETLNLQFIQNPYTSFNKIKYDDQNLSVNDIHKMDFSNLSDTFVKMVIINKTNPYLFDIMVDKLNKSNLAEFRIVEDNKHLDELSEESILDETESTEMILEKYVDGLEVGVDKSLLQKLMREVYMESLSV